ncbi:hypothetical protein JG688_00005342 [Phytophthora aleatoria]|uniref:Brix domain-containing protein n=1 Tax=Phytophthora aleatoria TaxID=2496075 RepID=A0A8J5J9I3_9STRA|nr:hypothetical protein JG688_00005342 [Phytophthora aleatoria]
MAPPSKRAKKDDGSGANADGAEPAFQRRNPSQIKNKMKRQLVMQKFRKEKKEAKKAAQLKRRREAEEMGEEAPPKMEPRTIDNTREKEVTMVSNEGDEEIESDERDDEFASIFANVEAPKLMITTRPFPSGELYHFIKDLMDLLPNSFYYKRGTFDIKEIVQFASNKKFTHLIVLSEKSKICNGMLVSRLPEGPTAFFKVSNVKLTSSIKERGRRTNHQPELILNNFSTRLGHRVGRFLGSLFEHQPEFEGHQVVTFHNQRDFIFVRHHRYTFENEKKARLQEIGPRFTMKLRWLQQGTFDTKFGEYEWIHKQHQLDTSRRKFHL